MGLTYQPRVTMVRIRYLFVKHNFWFGNSNTHGVSSTSMTFVQWNHSHQILTDALRENPSSWPENVSFPDSNHLLLFFSFKTFFFARSHRFDFLIHNIYIFRTVFKSFCIHSTRYILSIDRSSYSANWHISFFLTPLHYDSIALQYVNTKCNFDLQKVMKKYGGKNDFWFKADCFGWFYVIMFTQIHL